MTTMEQNACPACGQNTRYESAVDLLIIQIGDGIRVHDPLYRALDATPPTGMVRDVKLHFRCLFGREEYLRSHDRFKLLEWHIERLYAELREAQEDIRHLQNQQP